MNTSIIDRMDVMKKILACALILSVSTASAGWITNKIKSGAQKVKNVAKKVHNSSAAAKLRSKIKSGATTAYGYAKTGAKKVYNYASEKVNENFGLPYQIMSTTKKLRKATQTIENNYGVTAATTALIALCEECEAKPIRVMRRISDISNYIGEMEEFTKEDGTRVITKESTDLLLEYMRELNSLVYEYSLPYMNNIKKMLNEAENIKWNNSGSEEIQSYAEQLAKISDNYLKDTEYLEESIETMTSLIYNLQALGVDVSTLTTCLMNLKNLISSMQTLTKFKATGENLVQTASSTATNLQQTASMGATNLVNSANSAVLSSTEFINQGVQQTTEKFAEGVSSTLDKSTEYMNDFTEGAVNAVNRGTEYLNDSANNLSEKLEDISSVSQVYDSQEVDG